MLINLQVKALYKTTYAVRNLHIERVYQKHSYRSLKKGFRQLLFQDSQLLEIGKCAYRCQKVILKTEDYGGNFTCRG